MVRRSLTDMKHSYLGWLTAAAIAIATPLAAEASNTVLATIDGTENVWTIVPEVNLGDANMDEPPDLSGFAPQTGDPSVLGLTSIVMWAQADDSTTLMVSAFHRTSGEPSIMDDLLKGFLVYIDGTSEGTWVSDFKDPDAKLTIDSYDENGDVLTVAGSFATTAFFEAADTDEPDPDVSMRITGTFNATLSRVAIE